MAKLESTYLVSGRALYTDLYPEGSTLLGSPEGLSERSSLAQSVLQSASINPNMVEITLKDSSRLFLKGSFNETFVTTSAADFIQRASGTVTEIYEIEAVSPTARRYTLSDISMSIKDYFSQQTWEDVLDGNDTLLGGIGFDQLIDYGGNSFFEGKSGNDLLVAAKDDGNVAVYHGAVAEYLIEQSADLNYSDFLVTSQFTVEDQIYSRDGKDSLINIERLQFSDMNVAFDINVWDNAGSAYRLYKAAFDRAPDESGLGYWIDVLDDGGSLQLAASGFIHSAEFQSLYGTNPSDTLFLTKLYNNVLDRDPDQGGLNYWIGQLNGGMSRESALINFSESNENVSNVATLIENGIQYQPWLL